MPFKKEDELYQALKKTFGSPIGDDAAHLYIPTAEVCVTLDTYVQGVHFPSHWNLSQALPRCLVGALSDLYAMGAKPQWVFLGVGMENLRTSEVETFFQGLKELLKAQGLRLGGGDTVRSKTSFISLTCMGYLPSGKPPLLRSGAQVGDNLYLTGSVGGAWAGFQYLSEGWRWSSEGWEREGEKAPEGIALALEAFAHPSLPTPSGYDLHSRFTLHGAMDISDGFILDCQRLCQASCVGAVINLDALPFHPAALALAQGERLLKEALGFGEDYQLLLTSPESLPLPKIGKITQEKRIIFRWQGKTWTPPELSGYDPFNYAEA